MNIFSGDLNIYGKYASIIKKYSRTQDTDAEEWKISNGEDGQKTTKIFNAFIDCLFCGAAIGLAKGLKIKDPIPSSEKKMKATIFAAAWKNRQVDYMYLYRLMLLVDKDLALSNDERVKKACADIPESAASNEMNYFLEFAYGGLVELDRMLSEVHDYTELSDFACSAYQEFADLAQKE